MPDTTGNVPNLAEFRGQPLDLRDEHQKAYTRIHFFGTTADGSGGGDFVLHFDDGSTQIVPDVDCPTGASPATRRRTSRSARCSGRWTARRRGRRAVQHLPPLRRRSDGTRSSSSVTLPPRHGGNAADARAYLMALTLESADGSFEMPDLSGR